MTTYKEMAEACRDAHEHLECSWREPDNALLLRAAAVLEAVEDFSERMDDPQWGTEDAAAEFLRALREARQA